MNVVPGLLALLSVGFGDAEAPPQAPLVTFQVSVLEMDSIAWRSPLYDRLKTVDRQGGTTVWTTGSDTARALRNRAARVVEAPRISSPLGGMATVVVQGKDRFYTAELKREANAPRHLASVVAFRPEPASVREDLRATVCAHQTEQGLLTRVTCDATWLSAMHSVSLTELYVDDQGIEAGTIGGRLQVPELASASVNGEWLVPSGQVLVVSLGAYSVVDEAALNNAQASGAVKVCERLVILEPESASAQRSPLSQASRYGPFPARSYADIVTQVDGTTAQNEVVRRLTPVSPQRLAALAAAPRAEFAAPRLELPDLVRGLHDVASSIPLPPLPDAQANPASATPTPGANSATGATTAADGSAALAQTSEQSSRSLTLAEAIRIRLEHAKGVRIVSAGAPDEPILIAPANPGADGKAWQLKADVTAMVRCVEQFYWSLAQQRAQLQCRGKAVELGESALERVLSDVESGKREFVEAAEARERLENLRLQLVGATSDMITRERHLQNLLGLSTDENRNIVPVTQPRVTDIEPDWESSLVEMISFQPTVSQSRERVERAERDLCLSLEASTTAPCSAGADSSNASPAVCRADDAKSRQAQQSLLRHQESYKQVLQDLSESLARSCVELDANYNQWKSSTQLLAATEKRLASRQADYEAGRITVDRYLDAVTEWSSAVAQEAQLKFSYNTSIAVYEEAKGTLLAERNIYIRHSDIAQGEAGSPTRSFVLRLSPLAPVQIDTVVSPPLSALRMPEVPSRSLPMADSEDSLLPLPDDAATRTSLSTRSYLTQPSASPQAVTLIGRVVANPAEQTTACDIESTNETGCASGTTASPSRWKAANSGTLRIPIGGNLAIEIKATAGPAPRP
jgi:Outer membrane efflux protein